MDIDDGATGMKKKLLTSKQNSSQLHTEPAYIYKSHQQSTFYNIGGDFSTMKLNMSGFGETEHCQKIVNTQKMTRNSIRT